MDAQLYLKRHSQGLSEKYSGKCVAVVDDQVIAVDENPLIAFNKASEKSPGKEIAIFYMAKDEELITILSV